MNRYLIYCLAFVFLTTSFISCSKERSLESGAFTKAKGSLHDNTGNCYPATVFGKYYTGINLTDSNYIQVVVNVTSVGNYSIGTDTANGFSFKDAGVFSSTGVQTIKLKAAGRPLLNQNTDFLLSFDSTFCNVTILVQDSTGNSGGGFTAADSAWQFTGSKFFHGFIDTAFTYDTIVSTIPFKIINIQGLTASTADSVFFMAIGIPGGVIAPGTYNTNTTSVLQLLGSFNNNDTLYSATPLIPSVTTTFQITSYNTATRVVKGTFSGNAKNKTNNTVTVTGGKFEAKLN